MKINKEEFIQWQNETKVFCNYSYKKANLFEFLVHLDGSYRIMYTPIIGGPTLVWFESKDLDTTIYKWNTDVP